MTVNKKDCRIIARMLIAQVGLAVEIFAFGDSDVDSEDINSILNEVNKICEKLNGIHPINLGTTEQIVDYVKSRENKCTCTVEK